MLKVGDIVSIEVQTAKGKTKKLKAIINWVQFGVTFVRDEENPAYAGFSNIYHQGEIRKNDAIAKVTKGAATVSLIGAKKKKRGY